MKQKQKLERDGEIIKKIIKYLKYFTICLTILNCKLN
jgi:hypothetical protein